MKPYDFEVWYETYFGNIPQISFEQFVEVATVENKKSLVEHFKEANERSLKKDGSEDFRWVEQDRILELLYDVTILNRKATLYEWFMDHINIPEVDKYIQFEIEKDTDKMLKDDNGFTEKNKYYSLFVK